MNRVILICRALIVHREIRRRTMFQLVLAVLPLVAGGTIWDSELRAHPIAALCYWLACGWLNLTIILLAMFDILMVRREGRVQQRSLLKSVIEEEPAPLKKKHADSPRT